MNFEELFRKSAGKPVDYAGKTVAMKDDFPLEGSTRIRVTLEHTNSNWKQGIVLRAPGVFLVNEQRIEKQMVLWEHTMPKHVEIGIEGSSLTIQVKNVWDTGDGVMHSWHHGAAMIWEPIPLGRRYLCNDGIPDARFDDVIFSIERC